MDDAPLPGSPRSPHDSYAQLTPSAVLDALDSVGLQGDGRLLQLNSYENRVFQLFLQDGRAVVAKFYRPGRWSDAQILEEHALAIEAAAEDVPVVPPLVLGTGSTLAGFDSGGQHYRFSVAERSAGRAPELDDPQTLRWLGRFIARLHAIGRRRRFEHRRRLDVATFGRRPRQALLDGTFVTDAERSGWSAASERALALAAQAFARVPDVALLRLHGDCHPGNVLWRDLDQTRAPSDASQTPPAGGGPHFVDLDDACTGPAVQDLWMLLPGTQADAPRALADLLEGYETFLDFDRRELTLIEPLRTLRMIHHSAWLAERWSDPAFPVAFPWFGTPAYWSQQTTQLREQIEAMSERVADDDWE
jgi:Ser/Thr protein kinase RdoA (MazF antagonist)